MPESSTKRIILCFFVLMFIAAGRVNAQDPISPDRPGLGNGAYIVEPTVTYLESGLEYYSLDAGDQYSFGQVLIRGGLTEGVELRLVLNSFVVQNFTGTADTGVPDPGVGLKFNIYRDPDSALRLSGLGNLSIPIGSAVYTTDEWIPTATLLAEYSLNSQSTVTLNAGHTFEAGPLPSAWNVSITPGFSIPDSELGLYAGYAGVYSDAGDQQFIEAGITKLLEPFMQLDINAGYELQNSELFVGGGIALKF